MHQVGPPEHPNTQKNLGAVVIRRAVAADEDGILRCLAAAFQKYRADYTAEAFADTVLNPELLAARLQHMQVLVAVSPEGIVGTVAASSTADDGHLRGMAVLPDRQGSGLASKLLHAIETWLGDNGCKVVTLDTTLPLKAAIRFYEKSGYQKSGKVSNFFGMPLLEYVKKLG